MPKPFYITTTLPYINAPLHLGHALEFIRADVVARYKRGLGYDVFFNTGTDEHGLKIYEKAEEQGLSPQEFVNQGFSVFREQLRMFGISEDIHIIRTTDPVHIAQVQAFWQKVANNGFIYKKNYEAKYCVGCEIEKTDSELVNGECPLHPGRPLTLIKEENYFFKYSAFTDKLLAFYDAHPQFVVPESRLGEVRNFVKQGLQDFSISRLKSKMPWGIEVPGDPEQVIYVWFDALVNYLSTLGGEEGIKKYWYEGTPTQYCGKDNLRFQSAMWQAMLMSADLPNSYQVIINGFITGEGGVRMSKTLGNVVDPRDIVNSYGTDALRYFLLREVSNFEDSPFTLERFKASYDAGLVNGLGNLVSRVMKMVETNDVAYPTDLPNFLGDPVVESINKHFADFELSRAMDDIWALIAEANQKIQNEKPFSLIKTSPETAKEIIKSLVYDLHNIAFLLSPFLPETAEKINSIISTRRMPKAPLFPRID